jgi:hypothetical protein
MPFLPDDPVSTRGQWVDRKKFWGNKSFGYFVCQECDGRSWVSAHAYKQYKQACTQCNRYVLATYMWMNLEHRGKTSMGGRGEDDKPHIEHLCEACKLGVCRR